MMYVNITLLLINIPNEKLIYHFYSIGPNLAQVIFPVHYVNLVLIVLIHVIATCACKKQVPHAHHHET